MSLINREINNYKFLSFIDNGKFRSVYLAQKNNVNYAIKLFGEGLFISSLYLIESGISIFYKFFERSCFDKFFASSLSDFANMICEGLGISSFRMTSTSNKNVSYSNK